MSRRDLFIYFLIAVFSVGGGAVISGIAMTAGPATPFLLWGGISAVLLSGIGLCIMLFTAPLVVGAAMQSVARQPISDNAAQLALVATFGVIFIAFFALLIFFGPSARQPVKPPLAHGLPPAFLGPISISDLRDPKFNPKDGLKAIGQEEEVSGTVFESVAERSGERYTISLTPASAPIQVFLVFDLGVSEYQPGDHIYARCRIERADAQAFGLTGCAVISSQDWTSQPKH